MQARRWVLGWKATLAYAVVAAAVLAAGWAAARQVRAAREAGDRVRDTLDVLRQIGAVETVLLDAESAQRGYLLTGQEAYLEPFTGARSRVDDALTSLTRLLPDNPSQQERLEVVRQLASSKLGELQQTIDLYRTVGPEAALQLVNTHIGKGLMGRIIAVLEEAQAEERAMLTSQIRERRASFWWAGRVALASSLVALLAVAMATLAANAEVRRRAAIASALRDNEEWLRVTLRSIGDAVIATDRNGRVVFMNGAAQELTGWPEDDARDRALEDVFRIINEETGAAVESPVTQVLSRGGVVGIANHTVLLSRDGREVPIDDSGAPIRDAGGAIMGVVLVFRDISERKQQLEEHEELQRQSAARAAAERESHTKDEFLAILSHELRSPLQGILSWLTVLREGRADGEVQQRALQAIERGVRQQAQLVNDILDVSRIVAGKLQLTREPVDIKTVIEECVDHAVPEARQKGVEVHTDMVDCGVVLGDRQRLRQSVTNLLTNALKFTPRGGRVDVRCHRDGGDMVVTLRDTGAGIAPEFLPHIFDRFTQADNGTRPSVGGLGLGLSLVRQIMDVHGGSVHAESAGLGQGATFTLRIPLAPHGEVDGGQACAVAQADVEPSSSLEALSILLVDDDAETRESLAVLLAGRGAAVRRAASASAALEECAQSPPDVIISDISMPEQDGYAFVATLRGRGGQQHQPLVVALTGFAADSDRERAAAAGFDAHVPKPVDLDHLVQTILKLMEYGPSSGNDPQLAKTT